MKTGLTMRSKTLELLVIVFLAHRVISKVRKFSSLQNDPLTKTRCALACFEFLKNNDINTTQCRSECRKQQKKPGTCPTFDLPQWTSACVQACEYDYQCDGTNRCCTLGCGSSCSNPTDLLTLPGLPAIPVVQSIREKKKLVRVKWSNGVGDQARTTPGTILYLLQEQHHLGPMFEESKLEGWTTISRTNRTQASFHGDGLLKPGYYYRFRVASVSTAGSRGFSAPSLPFTPRKGPRVPPPPDRLRMHHLKTENGSISVRLDWRAPSYSDLPLMKYKVFWSRRVRGVTAGVLDSVLVDQMVVKNKTHAVIKGLMPNSMYFMQVQSVAEFGNTKLRSDKAALFYNTSDGDDYPPKIENLKLLKIIWQNNKIKARLSWDPMTSAALNAKSYLVQWETTGCQHTSQEHKILSATTEQTTFEIYELQFDCTYKVSVNMVRTKLKSICKSAEVTLDVPGCYYFQRRMIKSKIDCNAL